MRIVIVTLGSIGDLMPFLAVAETLRARGHEVIIASNAGYAVLVRRAGFLFAAIWDGAAQALDDVIDSDPGEAWRRVRQQMFLPAIEPTRACIRHFATARDCVVLASWSAFGAGPASREIGVPLCRVCLSPQAVRDAMAEDCPPRLGWFPEWFCPPQPDWPSDIRCVGFPVFDDALVPPLAPELEHFLRNGPPPAVFTPGSFMRKADRFFRESLAACTMRKLRAVFLTPYTAQIPANLPADVIHLPYAPLQRLAERAAVLVHHGGIGTCAQAMRSGVPQIAVPVFFDQFDNATRMEAMGVGKTLASRDYDHAALAPHLDKVGSDQVRRDCDRVRALFAGRKATDVIADHVSQLANSI